MSHSPLFEFIQTYTKPHPNPECPSCKAFGLRIYCPPGKPERTVCFNTQCPDYERLDGMPSSAGGMSAS